MCIKIKIKFLNTVHFGSIKSLLAFIYRLKNIKFSSCACHLEPQKLLLAKAPVVVCDIFNLMCNKEVFNALRLPPQTCFISTRQIKILCKLLSIYIVFNLMET